MWFYPRISGLSQVRKRSFFALKLRQAPWRKDPDADTRVWYKTSKPKKRKTSKLAVFVERA